MVNETSELERGCFLALVTGCSVLLQICVGRFKCCASSSSVSAGSSSTVVVGRALNTLEETCGTVLDFAGLICLRGVLVPNDDVIGSALICYPLMERRYVNNKLTELEKRVFVFRLMVSSSLSILSANRSSSPSDCQSMIQSMIEKYHLQFDYLLCLPCSAYS